MFEEVKKALDSLATKIDNNFVWAKKTTTGLRTDVDAKASATDLSTHTGNTTVHITADERTKWTAKQDALTTAQLANINAVPNKADKSAIPTKVSQLSDAGEYAKKTDLNGRLTREVVDTLPTVANAKENVIYMIPNGGKTGNVKDEYMLVNGAFELLGTTETDLSNYYTKNEVDSELAETFNSIKITDWDNITIS